MSCLDKLYAKEPGYPMDDIHNKLHYLLNDDLAQNKKLPPVILQQCDEKSWTSCPRPWVNLDAVPPIPSLLTVP